jgi:hypothetical protein
VHDSSDSVNSAQNEGGLEIRVSNLRYGHCIGFPHPLLKLTSPASRSSYQGISSGIRRNQAINMEPDCITESKSVEELV